MQPTRSTAVDLAEVSRVVVNVKKVRDVKLWDDAAVVLLVAERSARVVAMSGKSVSRPHVATTGSYGCSAEVATLVKQYFPNDYTFWFQVVIPRESNCQPGAQNLREGCDTSGRTNSHAVGLVQICMPLHDAAFAAVGCSNWQDLVCYVKAWRYLVDTEGRAPWGG